MEAINQRKAHYIAERIRRNISELRKSGADIGKEANEMFDMIDDLAVELLKSTPPRNCDVGTPDEQSARFDAHCRKHMGCLTCPLREADGSVPKHCEFRWAKMPYKEGGAK